MTTFKGRPWLKLSEAREGLIELDGGFTCHAAGKAVLHCDRKGLYFCCAVGKHHTSEQADDGEHCIGCYPVN